MKTVLPDAALSQHITVLGKTGSGKTCTRCHIVKPRSSFGPARANGHTYLRSHCKACDVDIARQYRKTPAGVRARIVEHRRRFDRHYRVYKVIKAALACDCCGESDTACIDFHHLTKKAHRRYALSNSIRKSVTAIIAEICKCIALCANCHRKLHAKKIELPTAVQPISLADIACALAEADMDIKGMPL